MPAADFLTVDNICGQTLLKLVSRGNAIITELLRLSEFVPVVFRHVDSASNNAYSELLLDFSYFKAIDQWDARIQDNEALADLDDEMRENYLEILTRFYSLFESIHRYATDLNRYVEELEDGNFIQQNLETVFNNVDGKQLLAEALYLYGVMLIQIDLKIEGPVRERMLVAYYRYSGRRSSSDSNLDDVCRLLRSTGFSVSKRPQNYPESFFRRFSINPLFVSMVIGRLRSDDIYNQISAFPLPDHRSTALSQQAAILYVCLFFDPDILQNQAPVMREIVDKYFADNWVISIYMGSTANLVESWEPYKAAKSALANVQSVQSLKSLVQKYGSELVDLNTGLSKYIAEGVITKEFVLDNINKLVNSLRRCNAVLRWLMLHSAPLRPEAEASKKCCQLRDTVASDSRITNSSVLQLLLNTAQFEFSIKEKLKEMFNLKSGECKRLQDDVADRLNELSHVFAGTTPLVRVEKNEKLKTVFGDLHQQFKSLTFEDEAGCGRKVIQLMSLLEEVQEIYGLDNNAQVKQFLLDVRQLLHQLLRTLNLKENTLVQMQIICDFSYAWEIIDNFTDLMQQAIRQNPSMPIKLRATFVKLSSAMDLPLLRIQQSNSPDFLSVSQFYSKNLVLYFRRVLQIIPRTVFSLLAKIVEIRTVTVSVKDLPTRLDKDKMKEYAKLDDRYEIARLTHSISVITEGILTMKATLVGVIKVDPKRLLEDGIRKELVKNVSTAMHNTLKFSSTSKTKQSELEAKLKSLANQIDAYRTSFEYISDYIGLDGLRIWLEEFSRIINYNVEQECNAYLRHKVQDHESLYQSRLIPIPHFHKLDNNHNFMGRLADEILKETDTKTTIYVDRCSAWYDSKTRKESVNTQLFKVLINAIRNVGVSGLDRLFSFMITDLLQKCIQSYKKQVLVNRDNVSFLTNAEKTAESQYPCIDQSTKFYANLNARFSKLHNSLSTVLSKVGQLQILRSHLTTELNILCKFESKLYENTLQTLNKAVMYDMRCCEKKHIKPNPFDDTALLSELSTHLEAAGISDPFMKIYLMSHLSTSPLCLFILSLVLSQIQKFSFVKTVGLISKKPLDTVDGTPFVIGVATFLRQIGSGADEKFIAYLGQALHSLSQQSLTSKSLPIEFNLLLIFTLEFANFYNLDRETLKRFVSSTLLNEHQVLC